MIHSTVTEATVEKKQNLLQVSKTKIWIDHAIQKLRQKGSDRHCGVHLRVGSIGGDVHVTPVAPAGAPRILDLDAAIRVDSNCKHTVVKIAAAAGCDCAGSVLLEDGLICFDRNRDRVALQSAGQCTGTACGPVTSDTSPWDGSGEARLAGTITSCVGIRLFCGNILALCPRECSLHQATIATRVLFGAINKLLLRHAHEVARRELPSALKTASCGEGPAASTLSLVLHRSDRTPGGPVNGGTSPRFTFMLTKVGQVGLHRRIQAADVECLELFKSHVAELSCTQHSTRLVRAPV